MTSNMQFTASDITEDDYEVGEYILYKDKPYVIKSFKKGKAVLQEAEEVRSSEFNKNDNEIGEIVYLDELTYQIKDFTNGKATLQYIVLPTTSLDSKEYASPLIKDVEDNEEDIKSFETQESVNEIRPIAETYNFANNIYEAGGGPGVAIKEIKTEFIETSFIFPKETVKVETSKEIIELKSNISTNSIIKKEIISSNSEIINEEIKKEDIYIASNSDIKEILNATFSNATKSTLSKGDTDIYGNVIEYDINNWIGEDVSSNNDNQSTIPLSQVIIKENDNNFLDKCGKLIINVKGIEKFKKTNIDLTILDDNYNLHIIRLLYKNNYSETFDVLCGHYIVYQVNYSNSKRLNDLYVENKEFTINPNETQEIEIYQNQMLIETQNVERKDTNTFFNKSIFFIFISIFAVIIVSAVIMFFIRKKGK